MFKLCFWMNIPSHYQTAFFKAVNDRDDMDLKVVYLNGVSADRAAEGWTDTYVMNDYESVVAEAFSADAIDQVVGDWDDRIHIISSTFHAELVEAFCDRKVKWCHWSEVPGFRLAELLGFQPSLFRLLNPLMLLLKRGEGKRLARYTMGVFGQGELARKAFRAMRIPASSIRDLYYAPDGLKASDPESRIIAFAKGRKIILSVGALCHRKGIDILLKSFARLGRSDWCVVLCGLDRSNGKLKQRAFDLGIEDQVLFLGAYPIDQIAKVYCSADLFVLSSRFDGWGTVLNEAASVGLPLIGSDLCGGSWHVIDHGHNGIRVKAGSVTELYSALGFYANDPALLEAHGTCSLHRFEKQFSPEKNAVRLMDALRSWEAM